MFVYTVCMCIFICLWYTNLSMTGYFSEKISIRNILNNQANNLTLC